MNKNFGRWLLLILGIVAFGWIGATALRDSAAEAKREIKDYKPWEEETLELAGLIPVQDGGRVKPLGTFAGFTMLGLHGARSMEVVDASGEAVKIKPLEWMLDCLFRPELAHQLPTFRVEDSEILRPYGIEVGGRRDRYSYRDLEPGLERMREKAKGYEQISRNDPTMLEREEKQVLDLVYNIRRYEWLTNYMNFARGGLLKGMTHEGRVLDVSEVMRAEPKLRASIEDSGGNPAQLPSEVRQILQLLLEAANESKFELFLFPPPAVVQEEGSPAKGESEKWMSAGQRIMAVFEKTTREPERCVEDIASLEKLARSLKDGEGAFRAQLAAFEAPVVARAKERGEYRSVPLEADYFKKNWFLYALAYFLLATVTAALMFFTGPTKAGKISYWATVALLSLGLIHVIVPIVKRSIIMMRPPVGNLYDTIIFITMALVIFALVVEWMTRKRFVLAIAPMAAAFLIVLARRFEVGDGTDHLNPLVAVLRSNYWLTTHVITITLGYAAGLISAVISVVYVLMRVLKLDEGDGGAMRRSITRSVYGCLCLTLTLSLIGTVLGGIWANDSWGRFWGWDPKENGALMIVLWSLAILHARLGGFIREWGLHQASIFGAAVVGFSWWHVNFLNVGLHNYGFAAEKKWAVNAFYLVILGFMFIGFLGWLWEKLQVKAKRDDAEKVTQVPAEV